MMKRTKESTDDSITADKLLSMSVEELYGLIETTHENSYIAIGADGEDVYEQVEGVLWVGDSFILTYLHHAVTIFDVRGKRLLRQTKKDIESIQHNQSFGFE